MIFYRIRNILEAKWFFFNSGYKKTMNATNYLEVAKPLARYDRTKIIRIGDLFLKLMYFAISSHYF